MGINVPAVEKATSGQATLHAAQPQEKQLLSRPKELSKTEKTLVLVDRKYVMPENAPESAPSSAEILDALSRIIPRPEQTTIEPGLLKDHGYATTCGTSTNPSQGAPLILTVGSSEKDVSSSRADKAAPTDLTVNGPVLHSRVAMLPLPLVNFSNDIPNESHPGRGSD